MRKIIVAPFVAGLLVVGATSAFAAPGGPGPAQSSTDIYHDLADGYTGTLFCEEGSYTIEIHYQNAVVHVTSGVEDTFVGAFLERARFTAVPNDPALPSYRGNFTFHSVLDNINLELGATGVNLSQTIRASGSDGSSIHYHETTHAVFSEEGVLISGFEKAFCK